MSKIPKEKNREYVRAFRERVKQGIVPKTIAIRAKGKTTKEIHLDLKQEIMTFYGGGICGCVKCGENKLACLSIDHMYGHGNEHRNTLKMRSGHRFYTWLKRQGFPKGYQTLCMNCQFVKRFLNHEEAEPYQLTGRPRIV